LPKRETAAAFRRRKKLQSAGGLAKLGWRRRLPVTQWST
jgi:hypothetical protein